MIKVASFFAGCGGLDLGFEQAGCSVVWANEFDNTIHETYARNHPQTFLCKADIRNLSPEDIPDCDGFIGGPPCQSWSVGGKMKGLDDERGRLFLDYIRLIKAKKPKFFLIENVAGIISDKFFPIFRGFLTTLSEAGYRVKFDVMNSANYGVPQERIRVIIVGIRNDLNCEFEFPKPTTPNHITLRQAIGDIKEQPIAYCYEPIDHSIPNRPNHDFFNGSYDSSYFRHNRVRPWDKPSFTILAQARNNPLHPQAPFMKKIGQWKYQFVPGKEDLYRRLSVRECARIQTFPDSFIFYYDRVVDGYKMVGNAVPPRLGKALAIAIQHTLASEVRENRRVLVGYYKDELQLTKTIQNQLYYVRTGFRPGSIQVPPGEIAPDFLLLYHGKNRLLLRLERVEPSLIKSSELTSMGFRPHGEIYYAFRIASADKLPYEAEDHPNIEKIIKHNKYAPFFL